MTVTIPHWIVSLFVAGGYLFLAFLALMGLIFLVVIWKMRNVKFWN